MKRTHRRRQTFDHRLRDAIALTGNPYLFRDVVIPRSTRRTCARGDVRPVVASDDVGKLLENSNTLRRVLARIDVVFSNSLIEAFWRQLKHAWLFLNTLDSTAAVRRLVAFYVAEHNEKISPPATMFVRIARLFRDVAEYRVA